jgi:peptide deformylase
MIEVGRRLIEAARGEKAYGLAAAHIGEVAPVVVISASGDASDYLVLYNPRVGSFAPETLKGEEASVSLPGVRVEVERPVWVEIDFMDATGVQHQI